MTGLDRFRGQIAPIAAISLYGLTVSLSIPLFGLLLERMGTSGTMIGLNHAVAAVATVLFAPVMPVILARVGLVRLMLWCCLATVAIFCLAPLWHDWWYWFALRALFGFCGTVLFFGSEYWIVGAAADGSRGRTVAVYAIAVSAAFMTGPLILGLTGTDGALPFLVGAAITSLGILPIWWGRQSAPPADGERASPTAALRFFLTEPALVLGVTLFGVIEFGVLGLIPVWALRTGLGEGEAVTLLSLFAAGALLFQWPIGRIADSRDPMGMLLPVAGICALAPLAMIWTAPAMLWLGFAAVFWGGLSAALYTLALTGIGNRYRGTRLSEGNAAIVLGYGAGAVWAPVMLGWAMDLVPPDGMLWVAFVLALAYMALLILPRRRQKGPKALDSSGGVSR